MGSRRPFLDERLQGTCVYCGGAPETSDHVPSAVFLDDPLPPNTPVVRACHRCNQSFSLDEEYLACFIECVLCGTTDRERITRPKARRALEKHPKLAASVRVCAQLTSEGQLVWTPQLDRVRSVVLKLGRGHAAYETGVIQLEDPLAVHWSPLLAMTEEERATFERAGAGELRLWPEIGSRAFSRAAGEPPYDKESGPWIIVQSSRYRYSVDEDPTAHVRVVISEYLACEVIWGN